MSKNFVLTLTGPDRIGIVERGDGAAARAGAATSRPAAWPGSAASSPC